MLPGAHIGLWANAGGGVDIKPLDYIESFQTGGQFIELTGIKVSSGLRFEIEYITYKTSSRLFGGQSSRSVNIGFDGNDSNGRARFLYGGTRYYHKDKTSDFNIASFNGSIFAVNDLSTNVTVKSFTSTIEPLLFGYSSSSSITSNTHSSLRRFDVSEGGTELNLRPYLDENGRPFLLNILGGGGKLNDGRFYNSGKGEFGWKDLDGNYVPPRGS